MKIGQLIRTMLLGLCAISYTPSVLGAEATETVIVGSKNSTESVILGEMLSHLVQKSGNDAVH